MPIRDKYYDHEARYRQIAERGGCGWDDSRPDLQFNSYVHLKAFLESVHCPKGRPGSAVLDLGCGGGQAGFLTSHLGHSLTGVDYSATAIELARENSKRLNLAAQFICGDCLTLNALGEKSFDLALDNHVLHCLVEQEDRASFLTSTQRVLKPGGVLFSATMSAEGEFDYEAMCVDASTGKSADGKRYWGTLEGIQREMESAGFEIVSISAQSDGLGSELDVVTVARRAR